MTNHKPSTEADQTFEEWANTQEAYKGFSVYEAWEAAWHARDAEVAKLRALADLARAVALREAAELTGDCGECSAYLDQAINEAKEEMRTRAATVCGAHTHANLILALPLDPPAPDTEVKLNAIKSNRGMDGDVDDNDPCESANDSRTTTPIGHVVGEGGECWCGETHENYHRE